MNSKVYIFANKHDENLLALYQECFNINIECVPVYFNHFNINNVKKIITNNDYIIILHFPLGSERLKSFISQFSYKKCLNRKAFEQESIGNKLYQQSQIKAMKLMLTQGVKSVILTLGKQGSLYLDSQSLIKTDAFNVEVKDTTAAGDTFIGVFAANLLRGVNLKDILKMANAGAAIAITKFGAQPSIPNKTTIEEFLTKG